MSAAEQEQPAEPGTQDRAPGDVPNEETGVGLGHDEESNTFEPEEDPGAVEPA
ncbi:hypothetical protein [Georgenia wangjunii]|uniref:hypothetical protein n=1 Tax=Georgenia wangjunii TaxID=3117730 RepID=UPI002F26747E